MIVAIGPNQALISKGLRRVNFDALLGDAESEPSPDFKGIKTMALNVICMAFAVRTKP
ncbi:hypothetical protein [Tepidimonas sp.]|uniref:hypothetical protein n=1 Tax=Tepidimonas sp. TaxID=2002775 RepID=UPI00391A5FE5